MSDPAIPDEHVETPAEPRHVGRPRVYSDAEIFGAINQILKEGGFPALTFDSVATIIGCTRQALARRFGSVDAMVLAYLDVMLVYVQAEFQTLNQDSPNPLEALRTRYVLPAGERYDMSADPTVEGNLLAFVLTASAEPLHADIIAKLNDANISAFQLLLDSAVAQGELRPCATRAVASSLHFVWIGEIALWCLDPALSLPDRLARAFDVIVSPFRPVASLGEEGEES